MAAILEKKLADVSWRNKILGLMTVFAVGMVVVGAVGAYAIFAMNNAVNEAYRGSSQRMTAALNARFAILEMAKAQAELVSSQDKADLRTAAVAAIKASSKLDESVQNLNSALNDSREAAELVQLLAQIKPAKMDVIRAARKDDDATAIELTKQMAAPMTRVEELSQAIVQQQNQEMSSILDEQLTQGYRVIGLLGGFIASSFFASLAISFFTANLVTKPMSTLEHGMAALAGGDLTVRLPDAGRDEVGRMLTAMSHMVADLHGVVGKIQGGADKLSAESQSLSVRADEIHVVSNKLHDGVKNIRTDAESVLLTSGGAMEELERATERAQNSADSADFMAKKITDTAAGFRRFQEHMENTAEQTRELSRTAEMITSITNTIRDISAQTNLLALNAAIEAARAGEHGRGFAVVADEVRSLATRTASATAEISSLIETISGNVGRTVELLEDSVVEARNNIEDLQNVADETSTSRDHAVYLCDTMQEVFAVMSDQQQALGGINTTVTALFDLSTETNRQTELLHALSRELNGASSELGGVVQRFKL